MKTTTVKRAIESGATSFEIPFNNLGTITAWSWEIKGDTVFCKTYAGLQQVSLDTAAKVHNNVKLK